MLHIYRDFEPTIKRVDLRDDPRYNLAPGNFFSQFLNIEKFSPFVLSEHTSSYRLDAVPVTQPTASEQKKRYRKQKN